MIRAVVHQFSASGALAFLLLAALLLTGCHPRISNPQDPNFVVAEKDTWTITRGQLDHEVATALSQNGTTPAAMGPRLPMVETEILKSMVLEKLMLARAATLSLRDVDKEETAALGQIKGRFPSDKDFQDQLKKAGMTEDDLKKQVHDRVIMRSLVQKEALQNSEPTDQDVNAFYLAHQKLFDVPAKLRANRVLIIVDQKAPPSDRAAKKQKIDQAHARVTKGEDFSKVAMEVSDDRYSAPRGGDIGYFQRGENESQFDDVAFASKVGQLSPVFESPMGFQFLKVTDSQPAGPAPISEARPQIVQELRREKIAAYSRKLLADSNVTYHITLTEPPADGNAAAPATSTAPAPTNAPPGT